MFGLMQFRYYVLILVSGLTTMKAQQQQHPGISYHNSWLYSMPWRPLILPTVARLPSLPGASQLSPGYTGPQTFPPVAQDQQQQQQNPYEQQQQHQNPYQQQQQNPYEQQQQQNPYQQQQPQQYQQPPVLLGLFTPQLQVHPLAAPPPQTGHFSLPFRPSPFAGYTDEEEENQVVPPAQGNQQQHQQQQQLEEPPFHAHPYKPVAEGSELSRGAAGGGYVYLSPSNLYNLVRS
ncbi:uncharacterized protein [Drosophila kikkawai]|uniref:Uncharacterized protein n=1 Tax=Drosophila kikkawai TaxID=30033 RepID=A0A6P4IMS3_DROKI|nr:glutenin, low molecular weight subunit [Drosophila kikkawai]